MRNKIFIIVIIVVMVILAVCGISYTNVKRKYESNETYYKNEFEIKCSYGKYIIKIPQGLAFENVSGNVIYKFKTLKPRKELRNEIREMYNQEYEDLHKCDSEGYELYYDKNQNITIGYKIDDSGITDLYIVVHE